jgi:hypothetical protein
LVRLSPRRHPECIHAASGAPDRPHDRLTEQIGDSSAHLKRRGDLRIVRVIAENDRASAAEVAVKSRLKTMRPAKLHVRPFDYDR